MNKFFLVECLLCITLNYALGKLRRPRGVSVAKAVLYQPAENFTCFDGLATIDFQHINDDYCDCNDGSDEPGTSACSNGIFDCANHGYRSISIPSSHVNDGICDCCDGSDEYETGLHCANHCLELGRQLRSVVEKQYLQLVAGHEMFKEYVKKGEDMKKEAVKKLESLDKEKKDMEMLQAELGLLKHNAEAAEQEAKDHYKQIWRDTRMAEKERQLTEQAAAVFSELDVNQDKLVAVDELYSLKEFDADNDGQVSLDEARSCLGGRDTVDYETFEQSVWNNMRLTYRPKDEREYEEVIFHEKDSDVGQQYEVADSSEEKVGHERRTQEPSTSDAAVEVEEDSVYDGQTDLLIAAANRARDDFDEVGRRLTSIINEIKELHRLLQEVSPSHLFYIQSICLNATDREHIYTLCPFHKVTQQLSSAGRTVLLGKWSRWIDEPGKFGVTQMYDEGDQCTNGQKMSARVEFECSSLSELVFIEESQRCHYSFAFRTPAACSQPPPASYRDPLHDEL